MITLFRWIVLKYKEIKWRFVFWQFVDKQLTDLIKDPKALENRLLPYITDIISKTLERNDTKDK